MCWLEDPLETYFCKQHPPGSWKDKLPLYVFGYANTFQNQKVFKPNAAGKVSDESINFESYRTSLMSGKIYTKQSLLSSKVSSSHQIPSYQIKTTSKLNEYINKLTLLYFNSFCQPFHIPFFCNIFDQHLFCCYENLFQLVLKVKKWWALNLPFTSLFSNVWLKFHLAKCNFFPTSAYSWLLIILVYILCRLKRKIKSEEID